MTGNTLDYTAHMYSSQGQTSVKRRQAKRQGKEYALHPPWLVLPDQASEPTLAYARAAGHRGDTASGVCGGAGGALPQTPEQKYRLIYLSAPLRLQLLLLGTLRSGVRESVDTQFPAGGKVHGDGGGRKRPPCGHQLHRPRGDVLPRGLVQAVPYSEFPGHLGKHP